MATGGAAVRGATGWRRHGGGERSSRQTAQQSGPRDGRTGGLGKRTVFAEEVVKREELVDVRAPTRAAALAVIRGAVEAEGNHVPARPRRVEVVIVRDDSRDELRRAWLAKRLRGEVDCVVGWIRRAGVRADLRRRQDAHGARGERPAAARPLVYREHEGGVVRPHRRIVRACRGHAAGPRCVGEACPWHAGAQGRPRPGHGPSGRLDGQWGADRACAGEDAPWADR